MDSCTSLGGAPRKGKSCGNKYAVGHIIFESDPGEIDVESAKSLTFWDALIKQDSPNGCYVLYKYDHIEPGDPEKVTEDLNVSGTIETGRTPEISLFQVLMGTCNLKSVYGSFKEGKDVYILTINQDETIEGRKSSPGNVSPVLARVSSNYMTGKPDVTGKVVFSVTQIEDYKDEAYSFETDFTMKALAENTIMSIEFDKVITNEALSIVVDIVDCNGSEVDDLTVGADGVHMFTAYDRTAGASLVIDPVAATGNRYSLTFGAGIRVSTNIIEIGYEEPSTTDQLYRNYKKLVLVNP